MTDYKSIADDDPGDKDLVVAVEKMRVLTEAKPTDERKINLVGIANIYGPSVSNNLEAAIRAAVQGGALGEWVLTAMISGDGLNIAYPAMAEQLNGLKAAGLTAENVTKLLSLTSVDELKYAGLTTSQLQKARIMRSEGRV